MQSRIETLRAYARLAPVIPVVTIDDARRSIDLAHALVAGGLPVVEITLRTPSALDAIAAIAKAVPDAVVAAGTVVDRRQIAEVADAGAKFIVTPGTPRSLAEALAEAPIPVMPGCSTVSEAMALMNLGFHALKFFPLRPPAAQPGSSPSRGPAEPDLLPDRRHRYRERADLSRASQRALRRRHLGCSRPRLLRRATSGHHAPRPGGCGAEALNQSVLPSLCRRPSSILHARRMRCSTRRDCSML